jgi:hypothetical protein
MRPSVVIGLAAACILAACGSIAGPSIVAPSATLAPTNVPGRTATPSAPADKIDMCALMPLSDVQAKSPFQTPLAEANPDVVKAGCTYTAALDAEEPVSVGLIVTEFDSPADAMAVLRNDRQAVADRGLPLSDITGLGDEAFSSGSDEVAVRAVVGARYVEAHFKGEWPDTPDDAKVVAGTELVRAIISRLP